jgi:hypothetical protein
MAAKPPVDRRSAFVKSETVSDFTGLTIDATALYTLSGPEVPRLARLTIFATTTLSARRLRQRPSDAAERPQDGRMGLEEIDHRRGCGPEFGRWRGRRLDIRDHAREIGPQLRRASLRQQISEQAV